jgi:MerR family mercuric resistance operon transcriptional regulator
MNSKSRAVLTIGRLSELTGVNTETIRYYERIGLIATPARTGGGHRVYDDRHGQHLVFIRRGRELGFSLDDIRTLLGLSERSNLACAEAKDLVLGQLGEVRGKIASLKRLERALNSMADACRPGSNRPCPIFDALSQPRVSAARQPSR